MARRRALGTRRWGGLSHARAKQSASECADPPAPLQVYIAPFDVRLPLADEPDDAVRTVVQPDLAAICDPTRLDAAGRPGAPDWVIEILSRGSAAREQMDKRVLDERAGVAECRLVHPLDRVLTIYRLQDGTFGPPVSLPLAGEYADKAPDQSAPRDRLDSDHHHGFAVFFVGVHPRTGSDRFAVHQPKPPHLAGLEGG